MNLIFPYPRPPAELPVMWRAEDKYYSSCADPDLDLYSVAGPRIELHWYRVVKRTPRGAHISFLDYASTQFIRTDARKRFAWDSVEEAVLSLIARREKQASLYEKRAARAREVVECSRAALDKYLAEATPYT